MEILVKRLSLDAIMPKKAGKNEAGIDLFAVNDVFIETGDVAKVKTDIALEIPEGYFGLIRDRSSMGSKGIMVTGGVIDSTYRGEIAVCLANISGNTHFDIDGITMVLAKETYHVKKGDKIAQLLILPVPQVDIIEVDEISNTERNDKGFGSTGR